MTCVLEQATLVAVDMQPTFSRVVDNIDQITQRTKFLIECAHALGVPIIFSEQNAARMGGTDPDLLSLDPGASVVGKMAFSCCGEPVFNQLVEAGNRRQVVLCGVETHICVTQTALDLNAKGHEVFVAGDAVSCRGANNHQMALQRLRHAKVQTLPSESVVYEWLKTAQHEGFRAILQIVKRYSATG